MPFTNRVSTEDLVLFSEVARLRNFSHAAERLGLTPSAVSRGVTRLEDKLGAQLLRRSTRRMTLTEEGEYLLDRSPEVLGSLEALEAQFKERRGLVTGTLNVSVGTAIAESRLTPALPKFVAKHPNISIDLCVTDRRVDLLRERVDLAIRTGDLADTSLISRRIGTARRIVCASPEYLREHGVPVEPDDLAHHRCLTIIGHEELEHWPFKQGRETWRVRVRPAMRSDSAVALRHLALSGLGIVRLADFVVRDSIAMGLLVPILDETHQTDDIPIWALYAPANRLPPRLRVFIDFVSHEVLS